MSPIKAFLHISMLLAWCTTLLSATNPIAHPAHNRSLSPSLRQISPGLFTCKSSDPVVGSVCRVVLGAINKELGDRGVSISLAKDGLLFKYVNPDDSYISTGHGCGIKLQRRHMDFQAKITSEASFKVTGNILFEPLYVAIKLPVHLYGRVDLRKEFGVRFLWKCRRYARDSFYIHGGLNTLADLGAGLSLKPSFVPQSNGDIHINVYPSMAYAFNLESEDIHFSVRGLSWLTRFWSQIKALPSGIFRTLHQIFSGDSIKSIFRDLVHRVIFRVGISVELVSHAIPSSVKDFLGSLLLNLGDHLAKKHGNKFLDDQEDVMNTKLRQLFKADSSGKRTFIVRKEIVHFARHSLAQRDFSITRENLHGLELHVRYSWPQGSKDLDTNTEFLGGRSGTGCGATGTYATFGGDSTSYGGSEESSIKIGAAERDGKWSTSTNVDLKARWFSRDDSAVIVRIVLRDENTKAEVASTTLTDLLNPGSGRDGNCATDTAGLVHVTKQSSGYHFKLEIV